MSTTTSTSRNLTPRFAGSWVSWPLEKKQALQKQLRYSWNLWAREKQTLPDGDWTTWLILAGRGFGKTRAGAETVRIWARDFHYVNLLGATADDARDIMIEGESGILAICPPDERPLYLPSKRQLAWPNGAKSLIFTADEPERLRGKQHQKLWCDELGSWRYPEAWDQARLGLRLGTNPQALVTTTPKPTKLVKEILTDPTTVVTRGSTYENRANLAGAFFEAVIRKYEGTRLGRQELLAELLTDTPGALWTYELIDAFRVTQAPELVRVVVAIDPAVTSNEGSDETGIVVAGLGLDGEGYVLEDRTLRGTPAEWATEAVSVYHERMADRIVGEANNGGEMVGYTVATIDPAASYKPVHASRGKQTRAEPISALYEQGRIHHVGTFPELEDQMMGWVPGMKSPDRMDALVWGFTELFLEAPEDELVYYDDPVTIGPQI